MIDTSIRISSSSSRQVNELQPRWLGERRLSFTMSKTHRLRCEIPLQKEVWKTKQRAGKSEQRGTYWDVSELRRKEQQRAFETTSLHFSVFKPSASEPSRYRDVGAHSVRCCERGTDWFIVVRKRKNWRSSSNARQKRDAEVKVLASTHRIIPLFDASMVLFQSIIEVRITTMDDIVAKRFANRTGVGIMAIGCHSFWSVSNHIDGLLEKAFGCFHISLLAEHAIHKVPIAIDGAIEITPLSMHACP